MKKMIDQSNLPAFIRSIRKIPLLGWFLVFSSLIGSILGIISVISKLQWQSYLYLISIVTSIVLLTNMLMSLSRNKYKKAAYLFIFEVAMRGLITAVIFKDTGFVMQFITISMSAIVIIAWLPSKDFFRYMPFVLVSSFAILVSDFASFSWQLDGPLPTESRFVFPAVHIILVLVYIFTNINHLSIRLKFVFTFISLSTISIISVSAISIVITQETVRKDAGLASQASAEYLSATIEHFIKYNLISIESLATTPILIDYLDLEQGKRIDSNLYTEISLLFQNWFLQDPIAIESYALFDKNGLNIADNNSKNIGKFILNSDILLPLESGQANVFIGSNSRMSDITTMGFSTPVRNQDNQIIGILSVEYKPGLINSLISNTNGIGGEQTFGVLIDGDFNVVGHGLEPELAGTSIDTWIDNDSELMNVLIGDNSKSFIETKLISRTPSDAIASVVTTNSRAWKVIFFQPESVYLAKVRNQTNLKIIIAEVIALFVILTGFVIATRYTKPILALTQTVEEFAGGNLNAKVDVHSNDEIGQLANTYNEISNQLGITLKEMEQRIQERTLAIETAAQVGRVISNILDPETLVKEVVEELQRAFGYYHVHIYLADQLNNRLVMVGGSGEVGEMLLKQGHNIRYGRGIVGRAAINMQSLLVSDTNQDSRWLPNPLLPDTASEIAVPIILNDELLGILDVQRNQTNALTEQDLNTLELIANQVAIALRNARHYHETLNQIETQSQINRCTEQIRKTTTIDEALQVALGEIANLTGSKKILTTLKVSTSKTDPTF